MAKSSAGPLFENFLLTRIILQVLLVKIFMPQRCIQIFSCDFFSIFSQERGPFWVTKSAGPGAVAPLAPLKTATTNRAATDAFENEAHFPVANAIATQKTDAKILHKSRQGEQQKG